MDANAGVLLLSDVREAAKGRYKATISAPRMVTFGLLPNGSTRNYKKHKGFFWWQGGN